MSQDTEITAALEAAGDLGQVGRVCRLFAVALGFEHFLYAFRAPVTFVRPCQLILSGYPRAWREHYDAQSYLGIDPVLLRALSTVLPFGWDELDRSAPLVAQLFTEAAGFGLAHGFSVPVHGAHGEGGLISLARAAPLPQGAARLPMFQRAQWFTALIHEKLRRLVLEPAADGTRRALTPRERECLRLAAHGLSAYAIGRSMNIAERTVVFHLNHAEEKLGARRRQAAIARAVALGQIEPGCYPIRFNESEALLELIH